MKERREKPVHKYLQKKKRPLATGIETGLKS